MSAVCILAPVVVTAWPAFGAAVAAAAGSLGYVVVDEAVSVVGQTQTTNSRCVTLEISNSELVTGHLGRDQRIAVTREGITVTFSRDMRGRASLSVTGSGQSETDLRARGGELSQRVVQQYVYQRLMDEMSNRGYHVVEERAEAGQSIHLRVRHWEN